MENKKEALNSVDEFVSQLENVFKKKIEDSSDEIIYYLRKFRLKPTAENYTFVQNFISFEENKFQKLMDSVRKLEKIKNESSFEVTD